MKIWITADTHFYHENIKKYQGRPDNFNERIVSNWNKLVAHDNLVIHLGDVIFGLNKEKTLPSLMATLPGQKVLCRGNHDPQSAQWYMERGFDFVCDYYVYQDIAFSHAPLTPLPPQTLVNDQRLVSLNIHGHFHKSGEAGDQSRRIHKDEYYDSEYYRRHQARYRLVQIEDSLSPVLLSDVTKKEI